MLLIIKRASKTKELMYILFIAKRNKERKKERKKGASNN
jgi:hypothetical protein